MGRHRTQSLGPSPMEDGLLLAFNTGRTLSNHLGSPIHRVFVSPFLRCVQTAAQVVSGISAVEDVPAATGNRDSAAPSKLKVCVEYGLCEKLNFKAIPPEVAPRDWNWGFNIAELETILPAGSADHSVERVYEEMPQWGEVPTAIRSRFQHVFKTLVGKYHCENIMIITHGVGVGVAVSTFLKDTTILQVDYCGYAILRRPVFRKDDSFIAGNFELRSINDTGGIRFSR